MIKWREKIIKEENPDQGKEEQEEEMEVQEEEEDDEVKEWVQVVTVIKIPTFLYNGIYLGRKKYRINEKMRWL